MPVSDPVETFTYDTLAERLGISRDSARKLAMRRRWNRVPGNDGHTRVSVPVDALPVLAPASDPGISPTHVPPETMARTMPARMRLCPPYRPGSRSWQRS